MIKNFRQNGWLKSRNLSEEKNPPRSQIFRLNNNLPDIRIPLSRELALKFETQIDD